MPLSTGIGLSLANIPLIGGGGFPGVAQVTQLDCSTVNGTNLDPGAGQPGRYFILYGGADNTPACYWFNVDGGSVQPSAPVSFWVEVNISSGATSEDVTSALVTSLGTSGYFAVDQDSTVLTLTDVAVGVRGDPYDETGILITVLTYGQDPS